MKITGIMTGVAILALAGCGDITASRPDAATPPRGGAAFDNGVGLGSGGIVAPGGGSGTTTLSTATTAECDSRSGVGLGSGGRTDCPTVPQ